MAATNILLVESDPTAAEALGAKLATAGHAITIAPDADEAFRAAAAHGLVVIGTVAGERTGIDVCRELRATPALAAVPVLCIAASDDVEERIAYLEVGADDVIARPFDERELDARVEALLLRFQRSASLTPVAAAGAPVVGGKRRIVAVYSPKGGVGTTTIATNLGVVLAGRPGVQVVLVDLDLPFGQVALQLNLRTASTVGDLARDRTALEEPELLRTYATRHESGLLVIPAPTSADDAAMITGEQVGRIVRSAAAAFDIVVVDAGSSLDERALAVLDAADVIVLPVVAEISSLKVVHALLDMANRTGTIGTKTMFVLNHIFARELIKARDVESSLGAKLEGSLPYDALVYLKAVNEGYPVVRGAADSPAADALRRLAAAAIPLEGGAAAVGSTAPANQDKRGGLFGGLRRR